MGDNRERIAFATAIGRHINNIYAEGELDRESTCAKFAYVPETRDRSYEIAYYNLDVIISVGYRVKSQRGVQFRQWATKRIHEYIVKGFTLDDERKNNTECRDEISCIFYWNRFAVTEKLIVTLL